MKTAHLLLLLLIGSMQLVNAEVRLNALFANHMVVQQNAKIPIWGWADPQERIIIQTSWGVKAETVAGSDSTWQVKLKTPKAGGPFQMTISGKNTIVIDDVLSGEVWLCTGQSNMDFQLNKLVKDAREPQYQPLVEHIKNEIKTADDPWLRHIEVPQTPSLYKKKNNFSGNWRSAKKGETGNITATGYFFAKELRKMLNVPIGLVECSWGGSRIQPWISKESYMGNDKMRSLYEDEMEMAKARIIEMDKEGWEDTVFVNKQKKWLASGKTTTRPWPTVHPLKDKQLPATLHNGMISAIVPFTIKGIIWYQGESNSHYMEEQYDHYFETMISSWREEWGQGDFPFYWMQLAGYKVPDERSDNGWALVNDHLRRTLKLPNTGMAVLYDIGEAKDVHPHNKMDAGKRLALWALKNDYRQKVEAVSGPLFKSHKVLDNKIEVKFSQVGSGLMVGKKVLMEKTKAIDEPLVWFEIAGDDGIWKKAEARIVAKDKIEVLSKEVMHPVKVRYAWSSNPEGANLYNKEGLPAAVFSTH